ncbi:unnamed protein product [Penicillium camemberti]|uniref:Str. FM013 n=1 Tax=Penicillium camemberti (strain FM 013) TaxID=1429867 RepID=A0A0G4PB26_PENC3|nr:unnamed protein product [Penicillium camemberti]
MLAANFDGRHLIFNLTENGRTIHRSREIIRLSERPTSPAPLLPNIFARPLTTVSPSYFGAVQLHSHLLLAIRAHIYGYAGFG